MKKSILITLCCASLMLVTPLVGVAQENTVSSNLPEQPNDVEGLVAQIRTVVDEILEKYGHIPMVSSLCNLILSLSWFPGKLIFCISTLIIKMPLTILFLFFLYLRNERLWQPIVELLYILTLIFNKECIPYISHPLNPLYTMLETKYNINTFDGCPCLQE